ncbi:MAG: NAD(P)-dependent glycerol-3-phosphate dehydrogenase [Myxococcales bacterium]|nr:NAD(P)-dependent glycerol-3-phosphate dehydrogenase [Myxococcales bacterium]MDD9965961.1 NAD(P)-dependent glycerol-3-phosphate dehydrogenase [Myxococcales bacterium]
MQHIAILGAGSWGTAIAKSLADQGLPVRLWARRAELAEAIQRTRQNPDYLPGHDLPASLACTADLAEAVEQARAVYLVVPSHGLREVAREIRPSLGAGVPIVTASKGIENETLLLMSQVLSEELPEAADRVCALGGPSFSAEVATGQPTAVCIGGTDPGVTAEIQSELATERLRVYITDDLLGVEVGGALKNVIAIAVGASDGLGFGHNARAALITRGLAEIMRLAVHLKAHPQTLAGLTGMGDLVLTCTGDLSRNRRVGLELGRGRKLSDVLGDMSMVAEGVKTAKSAHALAQREGIDMPITAQVYAALHEGKPPHDAVQSLLRRALRPERD